MASSSSPFSRHVTNLTPFSRTSLPSTSPRPLHLHLHHQRFSLSPISTIVHLPRNTCQPHRTSLSCGLAAAIPNYSSHRIIHRNHVIGPALSAQRPVSAAVGPTKSYCHAQASLATRQLFLNSVEAMQTHRASLIRDQYKCRPHLSERSIDAGSVHSQDQGRAKIRIQPRNGKPGLSGQRRSIGVAGPNFREKLRRFLEVKNGHILSLEDRIQTLERNNGETLLGLRRYKRKFSQIKRQLRCEVFRLKVERSFILLLLFFL